MNQLDYEKKILALIFGMKNPASLAYARARLQPEHFSDWVCRGLFETACAYADQGAGAILPRDTIKTMVPKPVGTALLYEQQYDALLLAGPSRETTTREDRQALTADFNLAITQLIEASRKEAVGTALAEAMKKLQYSGTADEAVALLASRMPDLSTAGSWNEPVPLGQQPRKLPQFPVHALPGWLASMVSEVARETQTPADLPGVVLLSVLATAGGGRAEVDVRSGWIEPVNLFTAVVMPPGSRKSAVFQEMTVPLHEAEISLISESRVEIEQNKVARDIAVRTAEKAVAAAANAGPDDRAEKAREAQRAGDFARGITVTTWPRLLADDTTPEAATTLLAEQGGRLAIMSPEGDIFGVMCGRYSSGAMQNLSVFLKGHAGDSIRVDRKGREPENIPRPALTIGLTIQPQVLSDIAQYKELRGRGLQARFLYSLPPDVVGHRLIDPEPVNCSVREVYRNRMREMTVFLARLTEKVSLQLTPAASKVREEFQASVEPRLRRDTGDLVDLRDWASKLTGAMVRIAGLLHLAEHSDSHLVMATEAISEETMRHACLLGEYFTEHARAAFDAMGADPTLDDARVLLTWIERTGASEFSKRDLHQGVRSARFQKATSVEEPLRLLEAHEYVRRLPDPPSSGGRRPSPRYLVNPRVLTQNTQNTHNL